MRVHHLNCGSLRPPCRQLLNGEGSLFEKGLMVCHCLLIESNDGLILVDAGIGMEDIANPRARLGGPFTTFVAPTLDSSETALGHVKRLGFKPADVRHVVLTHLDLDHAGGISDFPQARVHVYGLEHDAAMFPRTFMEKQRYHAAQWAHGPDWLRHEVLGEPWFGFEAVRQMEGLPPELLLIPLHGHTRGHCGVAVQSDAGWLLHGGDAYFNANELNEAPSCPPFLSIFQSRMAFDDSERLRNQARIRKLAKERSGEVQIFSAHDPNELARYA